jgi:hypothetical protein
MKSNKAAEPSQDSKRQQQGEHRYGNLENRFGKIGISAVAAAVRHTDKKHKAQVKHHVVSDSD